MPPFLLLPFPRPHPVWDGLGTRCGGDGARRPTPRGATGLLGPPQPRWTPGLGAQCIGRSAAAAAARQPASQPASQPEPLRGEGESPIVMGSSLLLLLAWRAWRGPVASWGGVGCGVASLSAHIGFAWGAGSPSGSHRNAWPAHTPQSEKASWGDR